MKRREIWRKKRSGKFYGNWYVTVDSTDVNLGTKNATIATKLVAEAERGRRSFDSDAQAVAADQVAAAAGGEGAAGSGENSGQPPAGQSPSDAPASPPPPAAVGEGGAGDGTLRGPGSSANTTTNLSSPTPPPPTAEENARAEADATNAAAADSASSSTSPAAANDNGMAIDPDALKGMLAVGAEAMVELQLGLQAWVIKRKTGKEPGLLPLDSPMRRVAVECWSAQFRRWFPDLDNVPPWILALVVVGSVAPYQLAMATPIPKKPEESAAEPTQAAA